MAIDGIGNLRAGMMALGALLVLVSAVPYVLDVTRGKTKPRIFSWIVWTLLGAIATVAATTAGEYASAALTAAATVETGSIVVLGWKYGNRNFEPLDAYCFAGVTIGLVLWAVLNSPIVGLTAALAIDIFAAIPTVRHAWRRPSEEPAAAYALCAVAAVCFLAVMRRYTVMGLLYPVYLLTLNAAITAIILRVGPSPVRSRLSRRPSPVKAVQFTIPAPVSQTAAADPALIYGRHAALVLPVERDRDISEAACPGAVKTLNVPPWPGRVGPGGGEFGDMTRTLWPLVNERQSPKRTSHRSSGEGQSALGEGEFERQQVDGTDDGAGLVEQVGLGAHRDDPAEPDHDDVVGDDLDLVEQV